VIALGEQRALASKHAVEVACDPDVEALHATRERIAAAGLDDEMQVIRQQMEMYDAKRLAPAAARDRLAHDAERTLAPEVRTTSRCAQGDMERIPCLPRLTLRVRHLRPPPRPAAPRAPTAVPARLARPVQGQLLRCPD